MPTTIDRAKVLADLAEYNHIAKRLICVDPDYEEVHEEINQLLDRLEAE